MKPSENFIEYCDLENQTITRVKISGYSFKAELKDGTLVEMFVYPTLKSPRKWQVMDKYSRSKILPDEFNTRAEAVKYTSEKLKTVSKEKFKESVLELRAIKAKLKESREVIK